MRQEDGRVAEATVQTIEIDASPVRASKLRRI